VAVRLDRKKRIQCRLRNEKPAAGIYRCQSELKALIAVEIIATGFSGLRFLRQSHKNMTEEYVSVYGNTPTSCDKHRLRLL
jgi:hypothetical protein